MADKYNADILRVAVAQICQTIGYNNAQSAPVELLQDVLHRFLVEFCRDLRRKTEHANRTEANLKDAHLSMKSLNIDIQELLGYISNVEPVPFAFEVPKFPARKDCKLNFLKPGSKEVLTRPVHIYGYLPPILQPDSSQQSAATSAYNNNNPEEGDTMLETGNETVASNAIECLKAETDGVKSAAIALAKSSSSSVDTNLVKLPSRTFDDDGRPTREISSVVMTTGGFISPAIEGKLADARIPDIIDEFHGLDAPPPPPPPPQVPPLALQMPPLVPPLDSHALAPNLKEPDVMNNSMATSANSKLKHVLLSDALFPQDGKAKQRRGDYQMKAGKQSGFVKQSKKAKKKMASEQQQQQQLAGLSDFHSKVDLITKKTQERNHRKAIKMLHKLNKTAKNNKTQSAQLADLASRLNENITPATLASYPTGSMERTQLEKMLKKQAKLRQKLLKQQQQQHQQQQHEPTQQQQATNDNDNVDDKYLTKKQTKNEFMLGTMERNIQPLTVQTQPTSNEPAICAGSQGDAQQTAREGHEPSSGVGSSSIDLKLTSEPDRTKLNIFKKISKQKTPKTLSPNEPQYAASATTCQPPLINLPSGTTITPAPALAPLEAAAELQSFNPTGGAGVHADAEINAFNDAVLAAGAGAVMLNANDLNKPKKRGRKPGSKNQVKNPTNAFVNPAKKPKQSKMLNKLNAAAAEAAAAAGFDATMEAAINRMQAPQQQFPGALNFSPTAKPAALLNDAGGLLNQVALAALPPLIKEKKERKKYKSKYNPLGLSNIDMATKEPPAVVNTMMGHNVLPMAPMLYPSAHPKSQDSSPNQKKPSPQKISPNLVGHGGAFMSPAELMAAKPTNMLPMLPLYPFPPRPGLIPTAPGFFPPAGMPNFGGGGVGVGGVNNSSAAPNLLMPGFLPFANFNPAGNLMNNEPSSLSPKELQQDERNFCKVAPLLPDSMKLMPLNEHHAKVQVHAKASQDTNLAQAMPANINDSNIGKVAGPDTLVALKQQKIKPNKLSTAGLPGKKLLLSSSSTASGNADDPIEVSDDSLSDTPTQKTEIKLESTTTALQSFHTGNLIQPGHLTNMTLPTLRENMFMPNAWNAPNLVQPKLKKPSNKLLANKTKSPTATLSTTAFTLDLQGKEKLCLAGGADLIPLMRTDSSVTAYPTIMGSSAAAAATDGGVSTFDAARTPNPTSTYQLFEGVTITPTTTTTTSNMSPSTSSDLKRRKEHKKLKKLKDGKIKKKKDKKDKSRSKERNGNGNGSGSGSGEKYFHKVDKLTKDLEKKLKKERKRERQRLLLNSGMAPLDLPEVAAMPTATCDGSVHLPVSEIMQDQIVVNTQIHATPKTTSKAMGMGMGMGMAIPSPNQLPKITLKISGNNSKCSTPVHFDELHEMTQGQGQGQGQPLQEQMVVEQVKRTQSPELARFSPLVTRPPKAKLNETQTAAATNSTMPASSLNVDDMQTTISNVGVGVGVVTTTSSNIWPAGGTLSASSVLLPQQLLQTSTNQHQHQQKMPSIGNLGGAGVAANVNSGSGSGSTSTSATNSSNTKRENSPPTPTLLQVPESNRPSSYVDSDGNTIWICPACGKVDDGSPMIGCDGCDAWYHWVCVGIFVAPKDNEDWFCRVCITRKKVHGNDKKRKRNKKK